MTTNVHMIAAEHQKQRIPPRWLLTFEEVTNAELASMVRDQGLRAEVRAYAGWELEYREAFRVEVFYESDAAEIRRRRMKGA